MANRPIIIFAKSAAERDFFRHVLSQKEENTICFEKEEICFDNLVPLQPKLVLARIDSLTLAWRFILALYVLKVDAKLLIVSNTLGGKNFRNEKLCQSVACINLDYEKEHFLIEIERFLHEQTTGTLRLAQHDILIGESPWIKNINEMIPCLAKATEPVLISGENGTGKEHLARIIAGAPEDSIFVRVDCNTQGRENILNSLSSEMDTKREALLSGRDMGGIPGPVYILLNKVNRLDEAGQAEILTLLDGEITHFNSKKRDHSNKFRIISTSEVDLGVHVKKGLFRKDLFYRLNVIPIHLSPLRYRKGDISILTDYFLINGSIKRGRSFESPTATTIEKMFCYDWPGNVDELKKLIEQYAIHRDVEIIHEHLGSQELENESCDYLYHMFNRDLEFSTFEIQNQMTFSGDFSLKAICDQYAGFTEKKIMRRALETTNWNRKKAAALLNISYKSMLNKMKIYEIV